MAVAIAAALVAALSLVACSDDGSGGNAGNAGNTGNSGNGSNGTEPVAPASTSFEFGPVEARTVPYGIDENPSGKQYLVTEVGGRAVFAARDALGAPWEVVSRIDGEPRGYIHDDGVHLILVSGWHFLRSTDEGQSWSTVEIERVPDTLATSGTDFFYSTDRRTYRSRDRGETWQEVGTFPDGVRNPDFAAGPNGSLFIGGVSMPVYESTDGGATWSEIQLPPGVTSSADLQVVETPAGETQLLLASGDTSLWTKIADGAWQEGTLPAEVLDVRFIDDAFWFDGSLHLVVGNDEETDVWRDGAGGWEEIYSETEGKSGLYPRGVSLWGGGVTLVQDRLRHTVVQTEFGTDGVESSSFRFDKELAAIVDASVIEDSDGLLALLAVETAPGQEGGMADPLRDGDRMELWMTRSDDGASWSDPTSIGSPGATYDLDQAIDSDGSRVVFIDRTAGFTVRTSNDRGETFTQAELTASQVDHRPFVAHVQDDEWFIDTGGDEKYLSEDDGATWTPLSIDDYDLIAEGDGRLVGVNSDGDSFESLDSGRTWNNLGATFPFFFDLQASLEYAAGAFWLVRKLEWRVARLDEEWGEVDSLNDYQPLDVVAGPDGVLLYGNDLGRGEMVIRRQGSGDSFSYVSADLGDVEGEHTFVDAATFGAAHMIVVTDRRGGRLNILRRDVSAFERGR